MDAVFLLPIAGLILPPRYALRLAGAGLVALLAFAVFSNTPPGQDSDLIGQAILTVFAVLFFGSVALGL